MPTYSPRGGGEARSYGEWLQIGTATNHIALTEAKRAEPLESLRHNGLDVDDIDALMRRLQAVGIEPSDVSALDEHPHRRRVYFRDDNGLDWKFLEYLCEDPALRNDYSH